MAMRGASLRRTGLPASRPAPLLVALHGSGRAGTSLVSRWQALAETEGIVLAGSDPTDSQHWSSPADGPGFLREARRKIPIPIAIGDRDKFFPIADARATVDALNASGFPAEIVEMRFHDHEYASSSAKINKTAWEFLSRSALETDPRFAEYRKR